MKGDTKETVLYMVIGVLMAWGINQGMAVALTTDMPVVAVESNSMIPVFYKGDILVLRGAAPGELEVGDVIVYSVKSRQVPVVHRIVKINPDGSVRVTLVAARYGFYPPRIEVPVDTPVTFRLASADVLHGVHVPNTNMTTMVVPGYISEVTTMFPRTGEYSLLCNEYCGLGHDSMWSRLVVVPKTAGGQS